MSPRILIARNNIMEIRKLITKYGVLLTLIPVEIWLDICLIQGGQKLSATIMILYLQIWSIIYRHPYQ